jgi:two-component system cell cycle response regulator CpdR
MREGSAPPQLQDRTESSSPPAMTANPFVILYVEDNDYIRESFAVLLATAERRIVCVADGAGARQAMREQKVNLLMTDINLPDGSGLDVAREALQQNPRLPVIVCSGSDLRDVAGSLGPTAHSLGKPFDPDELEALVERLVRRST